MQPRFRLLAVLAHPDDESLGFGGTLAKYAAEGVHVALITATRGERGRFGSQGKDADPQKVGRVREQELRSAAHALGVHELCIWDYPDSALAHVDPEPITTRIAAEIRRIRPHVLLTFGPDGAYGHPDHIAISQFTTAAALQAGDAAYRPAKLYYLSWRSDKWDAYQAAFRKLTSLVDGVERQATPWPDWAVTTQLDTAAHWPTVWKAVNCHQTQISIYERLQSLSPEQHTALWGSQEFYRVFSLVNGGRGVEADLFEGFR